jgi:hypothetical protein
LLVGAALEEHVRTSGQRDVFDPLPDGFAARCVGREAFRGVQAFRVELQQLPGAPNEGTPTEGALEQSGPSAPSPPSEPLRRTVYFDSATGFYLGRTAADESTVVLGDWRAVEGVTPPLRLPFQRTTFEPDTGLEHRWSFDQATATAPEDQRFILPTALAEELQRESGGD